MQESINAEVLRLLPHIGAGAFRQDEEKLKETQKHMVEAGAEGKSDANIPAKKNENKVGRNDLCPCGSGKKYKHCHGK